MKCSVHLHGVKLGMPKFFVPGCEVCEAKKSAGLVTGEEPPPPNGWGRASIRGRGRRPRVIQPFPREVRRA